MCTSFTMQPTHSGVVGLAQARGVSRRRFGRKGRRWDMRKDRRRGRRWFRRTGRRTSRKGVGGGLGGEI